MKRIELKRIELKKLERFVIKSGLLLTVSAISAGLGTYLLFPAVDMGTLIVLFCSLFFFSISLLSALTQNGQINKKDPLIRLISSLGILYYLLVHISFEPQLFSVFLILLAGASFHKKVFAVFFITVISAVAAPHYWLILTLVLSFIYLVFKEIQDKRHEFFHKSLLFMGLIFLMIVLFPIFNMMTSTSVQSLVLVCQDAAFLKALRVSVITATVASLITLIFGVPLAYGLSRIDFKGKDFIDSLIDLPIIIPHSVAGIAILGALGPKSPIGAFFIENFNITIASDWIGIIVAQTFVSSPFLIRSAITAFNEMGTEYEGAARTLGASPTRAFFTVTLPLAFTSILNGFLLTWSRAISEVACILIVASVPKTLSIHIFEEFLSMGITESRPPAVMMVIFCLWAFFCVRWFRWAYSRPNIVSGHQISSKRKNERRA